MLTADTHKNASLTTPSRTLGHVRQPSPAIRGASHVFSNSSIAPGVNTITHNEAYLGALAAASHVDIDGPKRDLGPRREQFTCLGGFSELQKKSAYDQGINVQDSQAALAFSAERVVHEPSPSFMAAQLAVSRATPGLADVSQSNVANASRMSTLQRASSLQVRETGHEDASVTPTKSLVQLYESKISEQSSKPSVNQVQSVRYSSRNAPPMFSPKPARPLVRSCTSSSSLSANLPKSLASKQGAPSPNKTNVSHIGAAAAAVRLAGPTVTTTPEKRGIIPEPPPPRRSQRRVDGAQDLATPKSGGLATSQAAQTKSAARAPVDGSSVCKEAPRKPTMAKQQSEPLIDTIPASKPLLPPRKSSTRSLEKPKTIPTNVLSPGPPSRITQNSDNYIPQLTVNSLANAMVASSLASSRAPSPTIPPPPPPRRHGGGAAGGLFNRTNHSTTEITSRTPSPSRTGLRQTLRKPHSSDEEASGGGEYVMRKSGYLGMGKHPNKHHEGDRKRYRTQVTEAERKRYEGVWAANRGLHVPASMGPDGANMVLNIVVRDIWRRSRLSDEVLGEVWELVNLKGGGWLGREEFVVGMWLIDQRLKGSKLPVKVSESVWASVRRLAGLQLPVSRY